MLGKAPQAVVAAFDYDLSRALVFFHRLAIVEHLISGFHQQQVALRMNAGQAEFFPLAQVPFGEFILLQGMQVALHAQIRTQILVRMDGRVDQDGAKIVPLREVGGVEAA